jgi:hypothetical protein
MSMPALAFLAVKYLSRQGQSAIVVALDVTVADKWQVQRLSPTRRLFDCLESHLLRILKSTNYCQYLCIHRLDIAESK